MLKSLSNNKQIMQCEGKGVLSGEATSNYNSIDDTVVFL